MTNEREKIMLALLSPAKNMCVWPGESGSSHPKMVDASNEILKAITALSPWQLEELLKTNADLAEKAHYNFQHMDLKASGTPAIRAYDGLVYKYFNESPLTTEQMAYAGECVRIISGFYGVLRATDGIMPYRLEMATKLMVGQNKNLYTFWGDSIYKQIYADDNIVVNLASEEYAKTVRRYVQSHQQFIDVEFKINKAGKMRTVTTYAKMARGMMARYITDHRIDDPESLKDFKGLGFQYDEMRSHSQKFVFIQE